MGYIYPGIPAVKNMRAMNRRTFIKYLGVSIVTPIIVSKGVVHTDIISEVDPRTYKEVRQGPRITHYPNRIETIAYDGIRVGDRVSMTKLGRACKTSSALGGTCVGVALSSAQVGDTVSIRTSLIPRELFEKCFDVPELNSYEHYNPSNYKF